MRTLITLTLVLTTIVCKSQTGVYHPFPDSNASWNIQYYDPVSCGSCSNWHFEWFSYVLDGDTMINSVTYHKLSVPFVSASDSGCCINHSVGYAGSIRQDIPAKKVYFIPPASSTEQLLYDFNLQVGDTIKNYPLGCSAPIASIDSFL